MRETIKTKIINFLNSAEENQKYHCNTENLNEVEKTLIFAINEINQEYRCFSPDEIPYNNYKKDNLTDIKSNLIDIAENLNNLKTKWKIHDFIWISFRYFQSAKQAFKGFVEFILSSDDYEKNYYIFNRCANLYTILKQPSLESSFTRTLYRMIDLGKKYDNTQPLFILESTYNNQWLELDQLIVLVSEKLNQCEIVEGSYILIDLITLYEKLLFDINEVKFTEKPCKIKGLDNIRREKTNFYLSIAYSPTEHPLRQIDSIKSAIAALKGIDNTEEERRLLQTKLTELKNNLIKSLSKFSISIDISETISKIKSDIDKLTSIEAFYYLYLGINIYSYEKAKEEMLSSKDSLIPRHFFTEQILDKHGGLEAIMPNWFHGVNHTDESSILPHIEKFCSERYRCYISMLLNYVLSQVKLNKVVYKDEIRKIVTNSWFVPESRKQAFIHGLIAGFEEDFMTAVCILAPQVEGAIRDLCFICGDATVKIGKNKTEEYLSLDSLLKLPKINECVDAKILFNIRMIFTSVYGFNIRNKIAHGIMDDEDFKLTDCFFTWWFVLRICLEFSKLKLEYSSKIYPKLK